MASESQNAIEATNTWKGIGAAVFLSLFIWVIIIMWLITL